MHIPTDDQIAKYYQYKEEVEKANPNLNLDEEYLKAYGDFEVGETSDDGFDAIEYRLHRSKLELSFTQQKYFFYSLILSLEDLGLNPHYRIPTKYKVKWAERKWYHRIKP